MAKKLEYTIGVDSSDGQRGVKDFSRTVRQELKNVEGDFDDTATAGERVATVLSKMAQDLDQELGRAAQASEALKTALGEDLAGRADIGSIIGDLQRMGLTFEDITTDADKLATSLKEMDQVQIKGMDAGLGGVKTKVGDIGRSADSSRSALANMIGNTTQDLGALGGIAGSAGVAIGQMGEYAADAALGGEALGSALKNMALVAGPIAALTLATETFSTILGGIHAEDVFRAELVDDFTDAIKEGTDEVEVLKKRIEETGELAFETGALGGGGFLGLGSAAKDVIPTLNELNINFADWQKLLKDTTAADRFRKKGLALASTNVELATKYLDVADALDTYQDSIGIAGVKQDDLNKFMDAGVGASERLGQSYRDRLALSKSIADTEKARLKLQQDEAKKASKIDEARLGLAVSHLGAYAEVQGEISAAQQEMVDGLAQMVDGIVAYRDAAKSVDWKQADIEGALAGMEDFRDAHFGLADIAKNTADAETALGDAIKENGANFDLGTEAGLKNLDAIRNLAGGIDIKLAAAYDNANGNQKKFQDTAQEIADTTMADLQEQFGLTDEQAGDLAEALGLLPEDIETRYELSGMEEAKGKLDLLSTSIDDLPDNVKTKVTQEIIKGDYVGALDDIQHYYDQHPASVVVVPTVSRGPTSNPIFGGPTTGGTAVGATAAAPATTSTTAVPVHVAGPQTVEYHTHATVNAAVVGSSFDVMRAVDAANRKAARLLPKNM